MDAFYAQVEVLDNPEYRGKPIIVGGPKESPRGVVSTCSYEARKFGVRSAMPIREAARLCPDGLFLPVRMARYEEVSRRIREVLATLTPVIEPISIDEAFLDMTGCEHFYTDANHLGREVKRRIFEATSLTSSVGVAPNKFLAKLVSDLDKPDGLFILPADQVDALLTTLPVSALWGVGPKTAARLKALGIEKVTDVRAASLPNLMRSLGKKSAEHIYNLAFGRDDRPVEPWVEAKSIGRETTFDVDVPDGSQLRTHLARLVADVGLRLRKEGVVARTVTVKVRFPDFETHTKSVTRARAFRDDDTLYREASRLLDQFALRRPLRLLGVYVSHLEDDAQSAQASLFAETDDRLTDVIDSLNRRLGKAAIRRGREL